MIVSTSSQSTNSSKSTSLSTEKKYELIIEKYLSLFHYENAIFLAERMFALNPTPRAIYLLALCHYHNGHYKQSKGILSRYKVPLESSQSDSITYLLSKCYLELNMYNEAEECLLSLTRLKYNVYKKKTKNFQSMENWIVTTKPCPIPNGASGCFIIARSSHYSNKYQMAVDYYNMSLKLDQMMYMSYEALCELGVSDKDMNDPFEIFNTVPKELMNMSIKYGGYGKMGQNLETKNSHDSSWMNLYKTPSTHCSPETYRSSIKNPIIIKKLNDSLHNPLSSPFYTNPSLEMHLPSTALFNTPNLTPIQSPTSDKEDEYLEKNIKSKLYPSIIRENYKTLFNEPTENETRKVASRLYYDETPEYSLLESEKESLECDNQMSIRTSTLKNDDLDLGSNYKKLNRNDETLKNHSCDINNTSSPDSTSCTGVKPILDLLCTIAVAQKLLSQYRCHEAIRIYNLLPRKQFDTGYILNQVGKAYFESADYRNAQRALEAMHHVDPFRMKGLELLSTTLWHLKKEVELSYLAQVSIEYDKTASESWVVVGNFFSLLKDHETALNFFRRAIQLNPTFTYAHTLSGHEYVANEEYEKAMACFRDAIRYDTRHYNAWYGLGAIYFRQEKYDLAEFHFHKALEINCQSSVLYCHLGMAQHANGKPQEALKTLSNAFVVDPRNPHARYQKGTILMSIDKLQEALEEFEKVRDVVPREASVHFALGRVLKKLGKYEQAMKSFLTALDLDPKDNNLIKAAMDRLDDLDIEDEGDKY